MRIKTVKVGSLQTNCYIVSDEKSGEALVIDPGDEAGRIREAAKGLKVLYIVITHGHPDHFGALDELKNATQAPVLMSPHDNWFFRPDREIGEGDEIAVGGIRFKVIRTPGHTQGGICLYTDGFLFSGDTLFAGDCGRTDLPGGSEEEMQRSLKMLALLPAETKVFPGHGEATAIGKERERGTLG